MTRLMIFVSALLLAACGTLPSQNIYLLEDQPATVAGVRSEAGLPIIELRKVSVPDYLDSTDILRRTGPHQVTASPTGRWGERLSLGLTDALSFDLSRKLTRQVVTTLPVAQPSRRLFVTIERADIGGEGICVIDADWQVTGEDGQSVAKREHGVFSEKAATPDDAAVASAMAHAVDQLATAIAATIEAAGTASVRRPDNH
jgi:uncharacterized lipoprotein YmbA